MYGTRYDRGEDRGDTTHYRSLEPYYRAASGSPVSRPPDERRAEIEAAGGWADDAPNGRGDDPGPGYGSAGYGPTAYGSTGYGSAGRGYGSGSYRGGGYALPAPEEIYRTGDGYRGNGFDDADAYGGAGSSGRGSYGGAGRGYGEQYAPEYRRRAPAEEYVPRRAANEPPRRAANEPARRAANEPPRRRPESADAPRKPVSPAKRKRKPMPLWQEMPLLLIVAFCLAVLIRTFLVQAFFIPSGSMTDTLLIGDRVLVNKVIYDTREPRRGEIVVFSGTDSWVPEVPPEPDLGFAAKLGRTVGDLIGVSRPGDKDFIKRVIGLPGDKVSCCDDQGRVLVNGKPLDEPYVIENSPLDAPPNPRECRSRRFEEITVPPGQMFVMGDHRLVSQDARCQGPVPIENVIGKAFVIVWPNESWATLPTPSTFDDIPDPVAAAEADSRPLTEPPTGIFGILLPILLALGFPARTRRNLALDRRRLGA